jgi:hypothetical protein
MIGALLLAGLPTAAVADEIRLRGGGRVSGVIVERTADLVVIEAGPGRVTIPTSRIETIVESRSALQAYQERAASLSPGDGAAWADLARWAAARDLLTQAREAWQRVLALDPSHPEANAALGRVEVDGTWMSFEDGYRARGFVPFEGRWVSPAEHEALVRERLAEEAAETEGREAELRVREAEARAREAEARAREAEAAAQPVEEGGIPLWWGGGGGWGGGMLLPIETPPPDPGHAPGPRHHATHGTPPAAPPPPSSTSSSSSSSGSAPPRKAVPRSAGIEPPSPPRTHPRPD